MKINDDVWFIIPAYNEEEVIANVINDVRKYFNNIVVINDASTDSTAVIAKQQAAKVINHPINLGQGAAIQTGIEFALIKGARILVTFDADGQHCIEDALKMIEKINIENAEIICGSRFLGINAINMSRTKSLMLKLAVLFTRYISKIDVTDAHNGLRVMTDSAAKKININQNKMAHATEMISQIRKKGIQYKEHPVKIIYTDYSIKKGQKISNSLNILLDLFIGGAIK